jgi:hypothetical protein
MPLLLILLMAILFSSNAFAQNDEVIISKQECEKLIRINSFSSPDYVSGVDAHGNKVKSADLNGESPIKIPDEISFNFGIDLGERYGAGKYSGTTNFGKVTVKGRDVFWNDQKLGSNENEAVLKACREQYAPKPTQ